MQAGATPTSPQDAAKAPESDDALEPVATEEPAIGPESDFDRLKSKHRKVRRNRKPLELEIPGYNGALVAKYRVLEIPEITEKRKRLEEYQEKNDQYATLHASMDNISMSCIGIFMRSDDGELVPLNDYDRDKYGADPICFDDRLAEFFESDADSVRKIIRDRFPEDLAILQHSAEINLWMAGGVEELAEDL